MKRKLSILLTLLLLTGCGGGGISESDAQATADAAVAKALAAIPPIEPPVVETVIETRVVEVEVTRRVEVEVTREVQVEVEVTRLVEVTATPGEPPPASTAEPPPPGSAELQVLQSSYYVDSIGYGHLIGTIQNNTDIAYARVKIVASFFDAQGNFVGTDYAYTDHELVVPGEPAIFSIGLVDLPEFETYELFLDYREADADDIADSYRDVKVTDAVAAWRLDYYTVSGIVANTGDQTVEFIKVACAVYDDAGQLIGVDYAYTELDELAAGARLPFEISFLSLAEGDPATFELAVEASPVD